MTQIIYDCNCVENYKIIPFYYENYFQYSLENSVCCNECLNLVNKKDEISRDINQKKKSLRNEIDILQKKYQTNDKTLQNNISEQMKHMWRQIGDLNNDKIKQLTDLDKLIELIRQNENKENPNIGIITQNSRCLYDIVIDNANPLDIRMVKLNCLCPRHLYSDL